MQLPKIITGERRSLLLRLCLNSLIQSIGLVMIGFATKELFDILFKPDAIANQQGIYYALCVIAISGILIAWLKRNERVLAEKIGQSYVLTVRNRVFKHMTRLSRDALESRSKGGIMLRLVGDLNALRQWVSLGLSRLWGGGIVLSVSLLALAILQWKMALTVLLIVSLGLCAYYWLGRKVQRTSREARKYRTRLAANLFEKISNVQVMQVFGQERREQRRVRRHGKNVVQASLKRANIIGSLRGTSELLIIFSTLGVLLVGVHDVIQGALTPGTLISAMSIIALLAPGLRDLGRVGEYWNNAKVSKDKIEDFLDISVDIIDIPESYDLPEGNGKLVINNCNAGGYLCGITVTAKAGDCIAIVGGNGAGKSTLMLTLTRLIHVTQGEVTLDGVPLKRIPLEQLRQAISLISPDLPLMRGSIRYNLIYRNKHCSPEDLDKVLELCDLQPLINSFEKGLATRLKEGGKNLSVGQRQRLALARALIGKPRLLLLDEVDSNLDASFTRTLKKVLDQFTGTVLLITHRKESLLLARTAWFFEQGHLVEVGEPQQLLQTDSFTSDLFNSEPKNKSIGNNVDSKNELARFRNKPKQVLELA